MIEDVIHYDKLDKTMIGMMKVIDKYIISINLTIHWYNGTEYDMTGMPSYVYEMGFTRTVVFVNIDKCCPVSYHQKLYFNV